jgi:MYXO-CTERM domain-containing protein
MMKLLRLLAAAALLGCGCSGYALADPLGVTSCVINTQGGNTCNFYENDANGAPVEVLLGIPLPQNTVPGPVLILEPGGNVNDPHTWSDELIFNQDGLHVDFLSDGCSSGIEGDVSCFVFTTLAVFEDASGFAVFNASDRDHYFIHSDGELPEPMSALLVALGLAALGWIRRRHT